MDEFDVIAWQLAAEAAEDCRAAAGDTMRMVRAVARLRAFTEGETDMAKPKPPVPKGGADTGKLGKHHGGNMHGNAKTGSTGKHAAPKGGGKK